MTAGAGFLVLFSTNRDEGEVWITAGDGLRGGPRILARDFENMLLIFL
jgi:hypothetical protein